MSLFKLRGSLSNIQSIILGIGGVLFVLLIWFLLTMGASTKFEKDEVVKVRLSKGDHVEMVDVTISEVDSTDIDTIRYKGILENGNTLDFKYSDVKKSGPFIAHGILPKPREVLSSYQSLFEENNLVKNVFRSIGLNVAGYVEAIAIALPIGFLIGLFPFFRGTFQGQVDAIRYVPLTAVTGLFIIWFGLGTSMKVHFLAFGILIYLLPVVVQRIDEVKDVYLKTVYTLGATDWQTIRSVYFPSVLSRLSDDIRVLTAISWTYIIIAESLGSGGGIGAVIWRAGIRQGKVDKTFALLIIIIIIGMLQDKLFSYLDKKFFPYKNVAKYKYKKKAKAISGLRTMLNFAMTILGWTFIGLYFFLFVNEFTENFVIDGAPILTYLFGDTVNYIHGLYFVLLFYQIKPFFTKKQTITA